MTPQNKSRKFSPSIVWCSALASSFCKVIPGLCCIKSLRSFEKTNYKEPWLKNHQGGWKILVLTLRIAAIKLTYITSAPEMNLSPWNIITWSHAEWRITADKISFCLSLPGEWTVLSAHLHLSHVALAESEEHKLKYRTSNRYWHYFHMFQKEL